jgi:hypothetical protein
MQFHSFMRGLPFYLQQSVAWYHPSIAGSEHEETIYEFDKVDRGPHVLDNPEQLRQLFAGPQRVFCITGAHRIKQRTGS